MSLFVTFEGPEGGGKSTQVRRLADWLAEHSMETVTTREPGGTPLGEVVRELLLGSQHSVMLPETEALLNSAVRAQHVAEVIRPALSQGKIVLCDRYLDSTLAYQGAGRGLEIEQLIALQRFATGNLWPDLTFLLDVPVEVGLSRRAASGEAMNRFDADSREFHERVRAYFLDAATREPNRWRIVDATQPADAVEKILLRLTLERLSEGSTVLIEGSR